MLRGPCASLRPPSRRGLTQRCWRMGGAAVCCAPAHICDEAARCVSASAAAILMLATGTTIHKPLLVPLFALQAPSSAISWITGDYGRWVAFLGLLLRLLYYIPGELELPLSTILLVVTAPYQFMDLRNLFFLWSMGVVRFFVLRGACASPSNRPPSAQNLRCWRLLALGNATLCCASANDCTDALRWFSITAAARLMLATGTTVDKYLLVPFFVLQAPSSGIDWIKGRDGALIASFISLLMRLLYWFFPGELVLAVATMSVAVIVITPFQFITLRESQGRAILSSVIAAYLAFQHFAGAGSLRRAFGREAIVATLCVICMTMITLMLVF